MNDVGSYHKKDHENEYWSMEDVLDAYPWPGQGRRVVIDLKP